MYFLSLPEQYLVLENTISITQHQTFFHFYKLVLYGIWRFKIVRIIVLSIAALNLLSWFLEAIAAGSFNLYSLGTSILDVFWIAGIYCILAILAVAGLWFTRPYLFKPVTYHFDHWGMHLDAEGYTGSFAWRKISKAEEKQHSFILYEANRPSLSIEKGNFESEQQIQSFAQLLRSHVPDV